MIHTIVSAPHSVLSTPAQSVTDFGRKLEQLIKDLSDTLLATKNPKGVGLAAVQIGQPLRVFVTKPGPKDKIRVFANPVIVSTAQGKQFEKTSEDKKMEGCLSIPNVWGKVSRFPSLVLKYQDERGNEKQERFTDFFATIIQHETDHCNGILYTQRVLEQHGKLYQATTDGSGKETLEEMKF
jgi:peptide deformylase